MVSVLDTSVVSNTHVAVAGLTSYGGLGQDLLLAPY